MDHKVLWIEEEGDDLADYAAPLLLAGYTVDVAHSITEALARLAEQEYDVVVCDLLVNAGDDPEWQALDDRIAEIRKELYLGLHFMRSLFVPESAEIPLDAEALNLTPSKVAIFTVVSDPSVHAELQGMGLASMRVKGRSSLTVLKELADDVVGASHD